MAYLKKSEFEKLSPIEKYKYLEKVRDNLRNIQKLSWRITQFDKKFPLESIEPFNYPSLLGAYEDFLGSMEQLGISVSKIEL